MSNAMVNKENLNPKGIHIVTVCDATSDGAQELSNAIESIKLRRETLLKYIDLGENRQKAPRILEALHQEYKFLIDLLHKNFKVREYIKENITVTAGRTVLAQRLAGTTTYSGVVNYTALGTGVNVPAISNTQLQTETYRKALSSGSFSANVAYIETFLTATETSGTFQEYGNFIDGSGIANSGQLFNRFLQTVTKTTSETMNIQSIITFADA